MNYEAKKFTIPELQGISKKQLEVHLGLYEGYVKHTNLLRTELERLTQLDPVQNAYIVGELRKRLGFEFNGMRLHELYFGALEGGATVINADSELYKHLMKQFGSFEKWLASFKAVSGRGPGWALLDYDQADGQFHFVWVEDHQVGQLAGVSVVLALDHWEHAYMVDYAPAEKAKYVDSYLAHLNWNVLAERFDHIIKK